MQTRKSLLIILSFLISAYTFSQPATKWRGPLGNGTFPDNGLLKQWPDEGPEILWSYDALGRGHSSATIADGFIYQSTMLGNEGYIVKLNMDGKLVWKVRYGTEFTESYPGARGSVTVAGDLLYMLSGTGKLVCMTVSDGKIKWSKDLFKDFDGDNITWGITETVLVDGNVLYCTPGGRKNNVVAIDRITGQLIWSSPGKGEKSAYCTPLLIKLASRSLLVTHTESNIIGVDASNGRLLWSYPHPNQYSVHPNTPIYHDGLLFCHSGYGQGAVMLKLSDDGASVKKLWTVKSFDSRIGASVLVNGYLYGSGDFDRSWQCLNWETGEKMYSSTALAKGVVIYADGLLYCYSERGELAIVKPDPSGFNVISKTRVTKGSEQHWAHPVIHDGILYVHHGSSLIAYKIK